LKAQGLYRYSSDEIYTKLYMYISPGSVCALSYIRAQKEKKLSISRETIPLLLIKSQEPFYKVSWD